MFAKLITGKNHIKNSEVCQDNWRAYYSINNKLTILVLSDGAGSSKKSNIGSKLICEEIINECSNYTIKEIENREWWIKLIKNVHHEILNKDKNNNLQDYRATLLVAIISHEENLLLTTHIGDGYVLAFDEINAHIISEPSNGEYVNETYFFTQNDFEQNLRIYNHELTKYKYIMLTSDGLEPIIMKNKKPFEGFFKPVIKFLINEENDKKIYEALSASIKKAYETACYDDVSIVLHEI